ncbi:MAG: SpoIID/LytB domain-containing protein, partial [Clostridiales bacterium]|nr:SpoIID/LytB domain-containing protein [Clostridiales bacterium]
MRGKYMKVNRLRKYLSVFLALVMCITLIPVFRPDTAYAATDGMIRVKMESMGSISSVTMKINGSYGISGHGEVALDKGRSITVSASGSTVRITDTSGQTHSLSSPVLLLNYADTTGLSSYITLSNTKYGSRSYKGSFTFYASSSNLTLVNTLFIEDYLCGVVANEMGNDWPIEALKAQTVAARTYAYKRMDGSGTYDIVDTSNDQVYKGYRSSDNVVIRAVNETKGMVLTYGGKLIDAYYSASNGGETDTPANVWSDRDSPACYVVKEDPYDVRNPASLIGSVYFTNKGKTNSSELDNFIRKKVASVAGTSSGNVDILSYDGLALTNPKYYNSINYRTVNIALTSNVGSYNLSFSIMDEIKPYADLEHDLRMARVTSGGGIHYLDFCRYGHGVGLSQRGAQQMATEGLSYTNILNFYYENAAIKVEDFVQSTVSAPSQGTTMGGTSAGSGLATMGDGSKEIGTAEISSINTVAMISGLETSGASLVAALRNGDKVSIYAIYDSWAYVKYQGQMGYISKLALGNITYNENANTNAGSSSAGNTSGTIIATAQANVASSLSIRSAMSTSASVLGTVSPNETIYITELSGSWAKIVYGQTGGYVNTDYIKNLTMLNEAENTGSSSGGGVMGFGYVSLASATSSLNIRQSASSSSSVVGKVSDGTYVAVYGVSGDWYKVKVDSKEGYISSKYVENYTSVNSGSASSGNTSAGNNSSGSTSSGSTSSVTTISLISKATAKCNLYASASTSSEVIETISKGEQFTVIEISGNMCRIKIGAMKGWILAQYADGVDVSAYNNAGGAGTSSTTNVSSTGKATTNATVNMRSGAG